MNIDEGLFLPQTQLSSGWQGIGNRAGCEAKCTADEQCSYYQFGWPDTAHCVTYSSCGLPLLAESECGTSDPGVHVYGHNIRRRLLVDTGAAKKAMRLLYLRSAPACKDVVLGVLEPATDFTPGVCACWQPQVARGPLVATNMNCAGAKARLCTGVDMPMARSVASGPHTCR